MPCSLFVVEFLYIRPMNIQADIGERIAKIREKKNLTQYQLAFKIKMDRTFITHVEKGRRNLSVQSLDKILKGLDTTFANFFKEDVTAVTMTQTSILHLTLKKQWFDRIASGEKKEEYRELKEYWSTRLMEAGTGKFKKYDVVRFRNGYAKDAPTMDLVCKKIGLGKSKTKWSGKPPVKCFVISLGDILTPKKKRA
jgi:transcriptional regulator with XRE-family HTH domain